MDFLIKKIVLLLCCLTFCLTQEAQHNHPKDKEKTHNPKGSLLEKLQPQGCKNPPKEKPKEFNQSNQGLRKYFRP
ncbi:MULTISPECIES: hypothetical protein [unclassified Helicobacter]|uniref:hypothetical protein n=1 Tax=unclassified Helicobacter TaxID=2593540 RepID=UPI000CF0320B|nr:MULTISPECIES: hypothetical protein [unclassified Helicobacter]